MESIKELREICQKHGATKPDLAIRIMRFFSIYFTWFFLHFKRITADYITIVSTLIFIIGIFCYVKGEYWLNLLGLSLIWLGIILDYTDGEMARYRRAPIEKTDINRFNILQLKGISLEGLTHDIKYAVLFIPLALGEYSSFPYPSLLIFLGFAASVSQVLSRLTKLRYIHSFFPLKSAEESYLKIGEKAFYSKQSRLRKIVDKNFGGTTGITIWLSLATILDKVYLVVIFYGILFSTMYLILLFKQYKGFKKL